MGVPFAKRGKRADEMLEVLRKLWTGEVVEHHGEHFDIPPLEMLPAPDRADRHPRRRHLRGGAAPRRPQRRLGERPAHHRGAGRHPPADRAVPRGVRPHPRAVLRVRRRPATRGTSTATAACTRPASPTSSRCPGTSTPAPTPTWPARSTASSASPRTSSPSGDRRAAGRFRRWRGSWWSRGPAAATCRPPSPWRRSSPDAGHDVRAIGTESLRRRFEADGIPLRRPRAAHRVGPGRAGARRARRGPQGRPRGGRLHAPGRAERRRGGRRAGRGARAHALHRQPRRRPAACTRWGWPISVDSLATVRAELGVPPVATLRRAARPVRQRAGDLPGVARPPVAGPAGPRPLRRSAARAAGRRRRLAAARGRRRPAARRGRARHHADGRAPGAPAGGRRARRRAGARDRHARRPPRPGRPRRARRRAAQRLRAPHRDAAVGVGGGHPRRSRHGAGRPGPRPPAGVPAARPRAARQRRGGGAGRAPGSCSIPRRRRRCIADAIAPRRHRPRAARRGGADGRGDRRARAVGCRRARRSSDLL